MTVRVLIAEDHPTFRATLRALVASESDLQVVGDTGDVGELVRLAVAAEADVVLLDSDLLGLCPGLIRDLLRELPGAELLLITDSGDAAVVLDALAAGAAGCVVSLAAESVLAYAIRVVSKGDVYLQPSTMRAVVEEVLLRPARAQARKAKLTPREVEVLDLISGGHTNRQIAGMLGLSVRTVESHRASIMDKLGLHTRAELARYATWRQLIMTIA